MSSTDDTLRAFYDAEIAPLQGKVDLALSAKQPAEGSFYLNRSDAEAIQTDFGEALSTPEAIGAALDAHWAGTALEGMGAKLVKLSGEVEVPEETATVSDLIYEMF